MDEINCINDDNDIKWTLTRTTLLKHNTWMQLLIWMKIDYKVWSRLNVEKDH